MRTCKLTTKSKPLLLTLTAITLACSVGCARHQGPVGDVVTLEGLQTLAAPDKRVLRNTPALSGVRRMAMHDIGMSLGAQSALAYQSRQLDRHLMTNAKTLDHVFDFNALLLGHNILPPVLQKGDNTLNKNTGSTLRISDRTFRILKQAQFITTVPNWRNYLMMHYDYPERPHDSVLPKNAQERALWQASVEHGWQQGLAQGNIIFSENLARLTQDYNGMVLYLQLLAQHMVSPPYVGKVQMGVTGNGNEIHINDQVLRITAMPQLQTNAKMWKPALSEAQHALQPVINWRYIAEQQDKLRQWSKNLQPHDSHPLAMDKFGKTG